MRWLLLLFFLPSFAAPANVSVSGTSHACGAAFCLTLTATSDAPAGAPSYVEITVPVASDLFTVDVSAPCQAIPSDTRVFVTCELVAWQGHTAEILIRLIPVAHKGGVWITPSGYVSSTPPVDLVIDPILVRVPIFTYLPSVFR